MKHCLKTFIFFLATLLPWAIQASEPARKIYTVGFAQDTMSNDWRAAQVNALTKAFAKHANIRFIYTNANGQTTKQIQDIEDLIHKKVDILLTSPRDANVMTPVISRAYKSGVPVILITRGIRSEHYTSLVAPDDRQIARNAAKYMARKMKGKGKILMLKGVPTATTAIARTEGFIEEISKYPGIKIVATRNGNYLRSDAIRAIDDVISSGIRFDAIYAQSDSMAAGARLALKKSGLDPTKLIIVGIDYINEARIAIRKGEQTASFLYPTSTTETVNAVLRLIKGKKIPKRIQVQSLLIDQKNVEKIKPIF